MPITRRQFDLGIDDAVEQCMMRIHEFLSTKREQAFSKEEIFSAIDGQASLKAFNRALEKLVEIRAVDARQLRGKPYYARLGELQHLW